METGLVDTPEIFQVELTSLCNMKCLFCIHGDVKRRQKHMSLSQFCRVASYFKPGQRVGLYMMGEPLLYPHLKEAVRITRYCGAKPEIATNGRALLRQSYGDNHQKITDFLLMGLEYVILDISWWKEDRKMMIDIANLASSIITRLLVLEHDGMQVPELAIQIVDHPDHPQPWPNVLEHLTAQTDKVHLKRKFLDSWAGQMPEMAAVSDVTPPETRGPCPEPFSRVAITCDGDVVPCCRDGLAEYKYGNIFDNTLEQIWNGKYAVELRSIMSMEHWGALPAPCDTCREWHINMSRQQNTEYPVKDKEVSK